jgi:amidase
LTVTSDEYRKYDAIGLAALIRGCEVTPVELLACAIAAIEATQSTLNTVVHPLFEAARQSLTGLPQGPFAGVPYLLKDSAITLAGAPMSGGSALFRGNVSAADSTHAARLRAAGLVMVGKTNTPELGMSFTTEPLATGVTHNPWDLARSPGGSSGGAAAAVAAGIVPAAHASDGAGSIRVPAAHCGLFGFKPSRMRNPVGPEEGEALAGLSAAHCITRSVRDSAALLDATAGPEPGDPYMVASPSRPFLAELEADPPNLRIALSVRSPLGTPVDPSCVDAATEAAHLCERLGHAVEIAEPSYDAVAIKAAWRVLATVAAASQVAEYGRRASIADPLARLEPVNAAWLAAAPAIGAADYAAALQHLRRAGRAMGQFFQRFDVLITPTTAELPQPLGVLACRDADFDAFYDRFWQHGPFTAIFNATGSPAMSVPLGEAGGLPVGVQFAAALGRDSLLYGLAGQLERAAPWGHRRPRTTLFQE